MFYTVDVADLDLVAKNRLGSILLCCGFFFIFSLWNLKCTEVVFSSFSYVYLFHLLFCSIVFIAIFGGIC